MKKNVNYLNTTEGRLNKLRHLMILVIFLSPFILVMTEKKLIIANEMVMLAGAFIAMLGAVVSLPINSKIMGSITMKNVLRKDGPFKHCRNPFYLGQTIFVAGASIMVLCWVNIVAVILLFILTHLTIKAEEKKLKEKFGNDYMLYKAVTPRYFPKNIPGFIKSIYKKAG